MIRSTQRGLGSFLFATALWMTVPCVAFAQAQDPDTLIQQGVELRRQGRDADALDAFQRAYEASRGPRALAQMGLAEQALGRWADADVHIRAALDARGDSWIAAHAAALQSAMETIQRHVGSLDVLANVPGAEVWIDGARVATLPLPRPLLLEVGRVDLEVRAQGYTTVNRSVDITSGTPARESVRLAPSGQPEPAVSTAAPVSTAPPPTRTGPADTTHTHGGPAVGLGPPVVMAAGAALLILGAAFIVLRNNAQGVCQPSGNVLACPDPSSTMQAQPAPAYNDTALVAFGVGAAAIVGGAAWLLLNLLGDRHSDTHVARRFQVAPIVAGALGLTMGGSF